MPKVSVVPKGRSDSESLLTVERAQADWIHRYMEQQEEDKAKSRESGFLHDGSLEQGDPQKIPKAFLHQLRQRSGWEAPNYAKIPGKGNISSYSISIMRKASGRGKSRKAGGLVTIELPSQDHASSTAEWEEGDSVKDIVDDQVERRAYFVDSLLDASGSETITLSDVSNNASKEKFLEPHTTEDKTVPVDFTAKNPLLKKEQEGRKELKKYQATSVAERVAEERCESSPGSSLYPNVSARDEGIATTVLGNLKQSANVSAKSNPAWSDGKREVHIHPSSINSDLKAFQYPFLVFLEKVETNKVFLRDTTVVSPYNTILLFGVPINVQHQTGIVIIDGWLEVAAPAQTAVLFKELRLTLHDILKELIRNPQASKVTDNEVLRSIIQLLLEEDKEKPLSLGSSDHCTPRHS